MPERPLNGLSKDQPPEGLAAGPLLAVAAFVALVHAAWLLAGGGGVFSGELAGADGYARLVRVAQLHDGGDWFDSAFPRANAPYGFQFHWTRLFDALLLALALPLAPLLGFSKALFWAGAFVAPLVHVFSALALAWAAMPILGRPGAYLAGALTAAQAGFVGYATIGHGDHHVLFGLIAILALGFMVRSLAAARYRRSHALAAGAILALGLWAGVEIYVFMGLCMLVLALPWLFGEADGARPNLHMALGLTAGLALVLLIERGPGQYLEVEYDRVSVIHLTLAALLLAFWWAVPRAMRQTGPAARLAAALAGAAVVLAVLRLLYPDILLGPLAGVDSGFLLVIGEISEFAAIGGVPRFLVFLGGALFAVPWALWRIRRAWRSEDRWAWVLIGAALLVFVGLAVLWIRVSLYAGVFLAVVLADLIGKADAAISARLAGPIRTLAVVSAVLLLAAGPGAAGVAGLIAGGGEKAPPRPACGVRALADVLNLPPWAAPGRTILASADFGPELLYRTGHRVIAALYHRNASGVLDSARILGGSDENEVLALIRERGVDLIVLCPGSSHDRYFLQGAGAGALYRRLERGNGPGWIAEAALPRGAAEGFRLFVVAPGQAG